MELHEQLDQVNDAESFLAFARALAADRSANDDWQNTTIEDFLEGAIAWAEDSEFGVRQGTRNQPLGSIRGFSVLWENLRVSVNVGPCRLSRPLRVQ